VEVTHRQLGTMGKIQVVERY